MASNNNTNTNTNKTSSNSNNNSSQPLREPRQPKLRFSCDACGAAKLKCDRGQPSCGRCINNGLACNYGVSRKMGRPRRERLDSSVSQPSDTQARAAHAKQFDKITRTSSLPLDHGPSTALADYSAALDAADLNGDSFMLDFDTFDQQTSSLFALTSLNFGDWTTTEHPDDGVVPLQSQFGPVLTPESSDFGACSPTAAPPSQPASYLSQGDKLGLHDNVPLPFPAIRDHECPREAYNILGSLSFPTATSDTNASSTNDCAAGIPLDHVLRLNRLASERLSRLMTCSCARSSNLVLLYAASISRILIWYQQAAACPQNAPWNPPSVAVGSASHDMPLALSMQDFGGGSGSSTSTWPSASVSAYGTDSAQNTPVSGQSAGHNVAPAKMAFGSFDVDDRRVEAALKVQLCLGEMKRAGRLIDQFIASHGAGGQHFNDECYFGGVDSLYQNLDSWLMCEHSRIADAMRSKLRVLNP